MPKKKAKLPLSKTHPKLAKEADGWDPANVTSGSGKKVKWQCKLGHSYEAIVASRAGANTGCAVCTGNKVLIGFNDLRTTHPDLAKEAIDFDPKAFTFGSGKKLKWRCPNGHIYEATIVSRTSRKSGCPICSNNKVLPGFNDLATVFPKLAKEAYGWDPSTFKPMSGKNVTWKCTKGHIFNSIIANRSKGVGCGVCANKVIITGINDLASQHPKIAKQANGWDPTKVGGGSHKRLSWKCNKGHTWITNPKHRVNGTNCPVCAGQKIVMGINDLATTNPKIAKQAYGWDPKKILAKHHQKYSWKCSKGHIWEASISARKGGSGCLVCTGKQVSVPHNSLSAEYPEIAKQAYLWNPETVTAKSGLRKKWICSKGHIWSSTVANRSSENRQRNCPVCSNQKVLDGFNDLQTTHPELAKEANGWDPRTKIAGSNKKCSWICSKGHTWESVLASRAFGKSGCPFCSGLSVWVGFNDLATTHPQLAKEANGWNPTKVSSGKSKKYSWICVKGHKYEARVDHRASGVSNCHFCSGHKVLKGFNDLKTLNPSLAKEAYKWDPTRFTSGSSIKKKWICEEKHIWTAAIVDRKITGCPTCSVSGFDPNADGYLYFLIQEDWEMFQIGITNVPDDRLDRHSRSGWKVLELRGPMDGHLTQQWETAILRMMKANGADLSNRKIAGKFDGYSEAWSKSTFPVKSIKELMRLTEEFEEGK